jgi:hypothetical protein
LRARSPKLRSRPRGWRGRGRQDRGHHLEAMVSEVKVTALRPRSVRSRLRGCGCEVSEVEGEVKV